VPFLLRKIRKAKWYRTEAVPWLPNDQLQADALVDLATKGNKLSVYLVDDDHANLEQIVAALAANADYISDFDYALFNQNRLWDVDIKLESTQGDTPDSEVNDWHCDLIELSASSVIALANIILTDAMKKRFLSKRVFELLVSGVSSGQIDRTKVRLKPDIASRIDQSMEAS
jgi:hypothetical protein